MPLHQSNKWVIEIISIQTSVYCVWREKVTIAICHPARLLNCKSELQKKCVHHIDVELRRHHHKWEPLTTKGAVTGFFSQKYRQWLQRKSKCSTPLVRYFLFSLDWWSAYRDVVVSVKHLCIKQNKVFGYIFFQIAQFLHPNPLKWKFNWSNYCIDLR